MDWRNNDVKRARSAGHWMAELCAGAAGAPFIAAAYRAVKTMALSTPRFTVEAVREAFPDVRAHDDRAWGAIIRYAEADGLIVADGQAPVKSSRGGFKTVWRSLVFNGGNDAESDERREGTYG